MAASLIIMADSDEKATDHKEHGEKLRHRE
jgi:hypothetical protein